MGRKPKAAMAKVPELQSKSSGLSSRKKESSSIIRRSGRLWKLNPPAHDKEIEPIIEINLCENDTAQEPNVEENPMPAERSLEDKIDYLVHAVDELKAKGCLQDDMPTKDLNYKSLYFGSQKKIEILTKENYELSKKADVALGKLEVYGETNRTWSEVLGRLKDVILILNLAKASETAANLSSQAVFGGFSSPNDIVGGEPNGAAVPRTAAKKKKRAIHNKYK